MKAYGIWCEYNHTWLVRFPGCVCNMFVGENGLPVALAVYNNMRNEQAYYARRGGYLTPKNEQERQETRERYRFEWLEAGYSVRALGSDGKPTDEILASGPLE